MKDLKYAGYGRIKAPKQNLCPELLRKSVTSLINDNERPGSPELTTVRRSALCRCI